MTLRDLKKGLLERMQQAFPPERYTYYATDVFEDYKRPSFFTQLKPVDMSEANYNTRHNKVTLYIDYMQEVADEADALDVIEKLRNLFGLYVRIGERAVKTTEFDYEFIGTKKNIPEITIDFEYMDRIEHPVTEPIMDDLTMKIEMEE